MTMQNDRPARAPQNALAKSSDPLLSSGAMQARPGTSIARIDSAVVTAMQVAKPRQLKLVKASAVEEASMLGESFYYSWSVNDKSSPTGKSLVEGVSIDGATILFRNWENCVYEVSLDDETPSHWTFKATFIDWEKGIAIPRLFRQRKKQDTGMKDADRQADIVFQIGQSKAIRNAIVKAMPSWLVDAALDAAKNASEEKFKDVPRSLHELRKSAAAFGIADDDIMKKIGKKFTVGRNAKGQTTYPDVGGILPRDLAKIAAVLRAIDQQQTTVEIEFRDALPPQPAEPEPEAGVRSLSTKPDDTDFGGSELPSEAPPNQTAPREPGEDG